MYNIREKIIGVAIQSEDGIVHSLPSPNRHNDVIGMMYDLGYKTPINGEQGFITESGIFVKRRIAADMALITGQIKKLKWPPNLYSEDLW